MPQGALKNIYTRSPHLEVRPLTLVIYWYTVFDGKGTPFVYLLLTYQWYPFNPFAPELPVTARADPGPF